MPRAIQKGMQNVKEKPANVNHVLFTHRICWNIEFHCFFYMMTIANLDQLSYFIEVNWNRWQKAVCVFSLLQDVHLGVASTSDNLQHFPAEALFGGRIIHSFIKIWCWNVRFCSLFLILTVCCQIQTSSSEEMSVPGGTKLNSCPC